MDVTENENLLAVYGTLKKGFYNYNKFLNGLESKFSGFITIKGRLISNGSYPLLISYKNSSNIFVEVYDVQTKLLRELDKLEAPFNLFREKIFIPELNSSVDIYIGSFTNIPDGFYRVQDGNWQATKPFIE